MNKFRTVLFLITGAIGLIFQLFGLYIVLILLGIITKAWVTLIILGVIITLIDSWKRNYFIKQGYKGNILGYTKPDKNENTK